MMKPHFVAHNGFVSTTFYFKSGERLKVDGYCYWHRGKAVRAFNSRG